MARSGRPIYLDHHSTTPVDPRVLDAMLPYFREKFGNASSVNHPFGWEATDAVETAREQIASLLHAEPRCLIFTSGATEANNLAIKGVVQAAPPGSHVVTTAAEHRSVLDPVRRLGRRGTEITIVGVDSFGRVDCDAIAKAIQPNTVLVSAIWANNEVGSLNPIRDLGELCRDRGVLFHTDAVQAVGKIEIDVGELPIDLLSASAHKLYGPKGVGMLLVRRGRKAIPIEPQLDGGGHEQRLRSGTLPVPLIVGFGAACRIAGEEMSAESARLAQLRDRLWTGLRNAIDGMHLNGHPTERLPGNLNVSFERVDGEALMAGLTGIAVSSGSACTSADPEPSHVLRAMGRSETLTRASLRFGLGRSTTEPEIETAISAVADTVARLRGARNR